jgi:hypothetical protein
MIPFFALLAPDHELPSIWLPTNTIKLISIPPLIFDTPLLLGISCPLNDLLTIITANHDRLQLCQDREVPEWAQKLSQQIIKGTGYQIPQF